MDKTEVISVQNTQPGIVPSLSCSLSGVARVELIKGQQYRIGRSSENDIMIPYAGASRLHALVIFENDSWRVKDLKSKNGVHVQSKRVRSVALKNGMTFSIGDCDFTFHDSMEDDDDTGESSASSRKKIIMAGSVLLAVLMVVLFFLRTEQPVEDRTIESEISGLPIDDGQNPGNEETGNKDSSSRENTIHNDETIKLYQLGLTYYDGGELIKAAEYWQQALTMAGQSEALESRISLLIKEIDRKSDEYYKLAMKQYKYKRYKEATVYFKMVLELVNDQNDLRNINARKFIEEMEGK